MDKAVSQFSGIATTTLATVTSLPQDMVIIAGLFLFFTLASFIAGKGRMLSFIFALYIAAFLFTMFPMVALMERIHLPLELTQMALFVTLMAISLASLRDAFRFQYPYGSVGKMIETLILGGSATLLILALSQNVIVLSQWYTFAPAIRLFLTRPHIFFISLSAPILLCIFLSKRYDIY